MLQSLQLFVLMASCRVRLLPDAVQTLVSLMGKSERQTCRNLAEWKGTVVLLGVFWSARFALALRTGVPGGCTATLGRKAHVEAAA